ncbi:MAG: hypothetical protein J6O89_00570, partial [Aeriscardovia sp.]|nr:hypothetical protein [Aeriscardovia sp.]
QSLRCFLRAASRRKYRMPERRRKRRRKQKPLPKGETHKEAPEKGEIGRALEEKGQKPIVFSSFQPGSSN